MTTGFTAPERAKAKNTRQAKRDAAIGNISPDEKAALRRRIVSQRTGISEETLEKHEAPPKQRTAKLDHFFADEPQCEPVPAAPTQESEPQPEETPALSLAERQQIRLTRNRIHQQHLNNPPMHVDAAAQNSRRIVAARNPKAATPAAAVKLFPPVTITNGQIAFELFRSLVRSLDEAQRNGNVEYAELLTSKIKGYADGEGAIWFRTICYGTVKYYVYDADTNRLDQYFGRV